MEARVETDQEPVKGKIKTGLVEVEATDLGANPEGKEAIVVLQEVPSKEAAVETIGALKEWSGDQHLAIGCCQ
jgi:hypothetical protein